MHILQINEFILFDKKFTKFINSFVAHNKYKIYKYCYFMHTNAMNLTQIDNYAIV